MSIIIRRAASDDVESLTSLVALKRAELERHEPVMWRRSKDADYDTVGGALLWTLEAGLGPAFTPEVEDDGDAAVGDGGAAGEAEEVLQARGDPGRLAGLVVDREAAAAGELDVGRGHALEGAGVGAGDPGEQVFDLVFAGVDGPHGVAHVGHGVAADLANAPEFALVFFGGGHFQRFRLHGEAREQGADVVVQVAGDLHPHPLDFEGLLEAVPEPGV